MHDTQAHITLLKVKLEAAELAYLQIQAHINNKGAWSVMRAQSNHLNGVDELSVEAESTIYVQDFVVSVKHARWADPSVCQL